jgi:class 3 adenylate cyclase
MPTVPHNATKTSNSTEIATASKGAADSIGPVVFFAIVKSIDHVSLLAKYVEVRAKDGEIELSAQFGRIFDEARAKTGVMTEEFCRYAAGSGYFRTESAQEAEALATEMILVAEAQNSQTPDRELHKRMAAVIVAARPDPAAPSGPAECSDAIDVAEQLVHEMQPGEVRLTEDTYHALSADKAKLYEQASTNADRPPGNAPAGASWRRIVVAAAPPPQTIYRAVMVIDMAQYGRVKNNMQLMFGAMAVPTLDGQIVSIISTGFKQAGAASYERYMHKWGGDGGIFFFESTDLAHRVAVEVLRQAEAQQNRKARETPCEDAMRCFRIGIDYGKLERMTGGGAATGRVEYSGDSLSRSERLQNGGPSGEVRISEEFYQRLTEDLRKAYGDKEPIFGKGHEPKPIQARRLFVADRAPWPELGRDNKAFPPIRQPNADFPATVETPTARELCFVICPLGEDQPRVAQVFDRLITPACASAGYTVRRATDLPGNRKTIIAENLWGAPLVVAYLGNPLQWNYNVILEVGIRLATGLPLVMLSDPMESGREPDYQRLLPFQVVHDNVITVPKEPGQRLQKLIDEIGNTRARLSNAWESLNPVLEFRYTTYDNVIITDANETARRVFGADVVSPGQGVERLRKAFADRTDPVQAEARRDEQMAILDALMAQAVRGQNATRNWRPPKARIPVVFRDAEVDAATGKPVGYLPIIVRYHFDQQWTRVRYLYLRVSAGMQKLDGLAYYICDL